MKSVDEIVSEIAERSLAVNGPNEVSNLYTVMMEIHRAVGDLMAQILEQKRNAKGA